MDRRGIRDAGLEAVAPAHAGLDRLEAVELDPHQLLEAGSLDELDPAAVRRDVEHPDSKIELAGTPQRNFGTKRDPFAAALRKAGRIHVRHLVRRAATAARNP